MLAKITLYDGTVYKIASQTVDTEDGIYLGRIKDELSLVSAMQEAGNAPATINLTIINDDDFIPHNKDLWAAEVLLTNENGVSWRGKINFCNFDADGNLYVTASEKTAPELELQLPDEVRQVYTVDEDFHQSSVTMTIPLVIGGTTSNPILLPTILIDKTEGVYLICVGEIRSVIKVYNGVEELPNTAYTAYTGTSSQAEHAGFAYVKINEDYRLNADGSYAEINVEVVGLKLANFTEEECRNGALFLYYFLTTAATGINGWGCGIDQSEIDTASFQSAITLCNQLGYKLDGIMWLRQSAQSWIDQICQAIHGKYSINANGKRSLFIDYAANASKKTFTASNMQVDKYGKNSYTSVVYNKGILSYDYNPITGLFMQSAQYENADSIAQIGEQKFVGESYLLKDPTTALAVLEYTCKRSQTAAEAIEFKTDDIDTVLKAGDVITINRPDLSINNALYQIQNISITDYEASISAVKFDTSVFIVSGTPSSVNWGSEKAITPALTPAQATNLLLSTGFDINPDGTGTPYISGTFTVPDGGWLAAAVQYGIGANPSNWTELALITDGRFKISPVNVGTVYSVRIRMITATGHSDYLRGQITATGDTTPPLAPTIAVNATDKTVTVQCGLDSPPYDFAGFQIYRKKSTESDSAYTFIGNAVSNRGLNGNSQPNGYASFTDYVSEYVTYNYKAKSYDRSGNLSTNFSNVATIAITGITANDVAATALAMPTGSILRLSAKNCTTASIAEANGVKDVSGRGNHGRAGTGVSVSQDNKKGDVFDFAATNGGITIANKVPVNANSGITYSFYINSSNFNVSSNYPQQIRHFDATSGNSNGGFIIMVLASQYGIIHYNGTTEVWRLEQRKSFSLNTWYHFAFSIDPTNGTKMFIDGELAYTDSSKKIQYSGNTPLLINTSGGGRACKLCDIRIYPRALSATEIKSIFMIPDEAVFAQLTTDMFGANIIHANYILNDGAFASLAVQAVNADIQNLNVVGNATFQSTLNSAIDDIEVGGRNLARGTAEMKSGSGYWSTGTWRSSGTGTITYNVDVTDSPIKSLVSKGIRLTTSSGQTNIGFAQDIVYLEAGNITMSCWAKGTSGASFLLQAFYKSGVAGSEAFTLNGNWQYFSFTRAIASADTYSIAYGYLRTASATVDIVGIKLEYGSKATTWTPAPEDVDSDINTVQSNLNTVTNNIYSPNTTTINGGKITTGTIQTEALAANAITAQKLNVTAIRKPIGAVSSIRAKGNSTTSGATLDAGTLIGDESGGKNPFVTVSAVKFYINSSLGDYFALANDASYLKSKYNMNISNNMTYRLRLYINSLTTGSADSQWIRHITSSSTTGIIVGVTSGGVIKIHHFLNGSNTWTYTTGITLSINTFYDIVVVSNTSRTALYINGVKRIENTAYKNGASGSGTISLGFSGGNCIGLIQAFDFYGRTLSDDEVKTLFALGPDTESGQITADRLAVDAIRGRNASGGGDGAYTTQGLVMSLAGNGWLSAKNFYLKSDGSANYKGAVEASSGKIGSFALNSNGTLKGNMSDSSIVGIELETTGTNSYSSKFKSNGVVISGSSYTCSIASSGFDFTTASDATETYSIPGYLKLKRVLSGGGSNLVELNKTSSAPTTYSNAAVVITPSATSNFGLYVAGKARINTTDYGSDEKTKKDFQDVSTLNKLKALRVCAWRFDEEKLVEKDNAFIDAENIKIEAENKTIDAENAEIEKENEKRKNRKDGEPVELLPLKEHKKLRERRTADKNANHPLNIGCMAGEFNKAFGTNDGSEDCLSVTDTIGVCMRSIQELAAEVDDLKAKLKIQQDEKSEIIEHFNELTKEPTDEDELVEPSFDELLENGENQQGEQK